MMDHEHRHGKRNTRKEEHVPGSLDIVAHNGHSVEPCRRYHSQRITLMSIEGALSSTDQLFINAPIFSRSWMIQAKLHI